MERLDKANFIHPEAPKGKTEMIPGENLWNEFDKVGQEKREARLEEVIELKKHSNWLKQFLFIHQDHLDLDRTLSDLLFVAEDKKNFLENEVSDESIASAEVLKSEIEWFDRRSNLDKLLSLKIILQELDKKERKLISDIESL